MLHQWNSGCNDDEVYQLVGHKHKEVLSDKILHVIEWGNFKSAIDYAYISIAEVKAAISKLSLSRNRRQFIIRLLLIRELNNRDVDIYFDDYRQPSTIEAAIINGSRSIAELPKHDDVIDLLLRNGVRIDNSVDLYQLMQADRWQDVLERSDDHDIVQYLILRLSTLAITPYWPVARKYYEVILINILYHIGVEHYEVIRNRVADIRKEAKLSDDNLPSNWIVLALNNATPLQRAYISCYPQLYSVAGNEWWDKYKDSIDETFANKTLTKLQKLHDAERMKWSDYKINNECDITYIELTNYHPALLVVSPAPNGVLHVFGPRDFAYILEKKINIWSKDVISDDVLNEVKARVSLMEKLKLTAELSDIKSLLETPRKLLQWLGGHVRKTNSKHNDKILEAVLTFVNILQGIINM